LLKTYGIDISGFIFYKQFMQRKLHEGMNAQNLQSYVQAFRAISAPCAGWPPVDSKKLFSMFDPEQISAILPFLYKHLLYQKHLLYIKRREFVA
jgi:hypothetical protein